MLLSSVLHIANVTFLSRDKTGDNAEIENANVLHTGCSSLNHISPK